MSEMFGGRSWTIRPGESKVIELDDVARLKVDLVRGRVDVVGSDDPVTRVEVSNVQGLDVRVSLNEDGRLKIDHPDANKTINVHGMRDGLGVLRGMFGKSDRDALCSADVSIVVPREVKAKINMVRGDTLVSGLTAGAKLDTVSGTVLSDSLQGELKLDTVSGRVEARSHRGSIDVNSVNGEVVLSGEYSKIDLNSVSGATYLDAFGAPSKLGLNVVSGNAIVRVDADAHTVYKADAMFGSVSVDGHKFKVPKSGFKYEDGPEDGPCVDIRFNAVSGSLKVVHRAAADDDEAPVAADDSANVSNPADANPAETADPAEAANPAETPEGR